MSGALGELVVSISADLARFREDMGKANRVTQDTMNRMHSDVAGGIGRIERSFSSLGTAVGGALSVGALVTFGKECVNAALAAEKLNMQFKASTGNANIAGQELKYVKDLAASLGLEVRGTAEAYGKFLASTRDTSIEGEKTRKVFEGVSEASTALGLSADETKGIFLALSQMMSKGKVQAEELTGQLGERLPGALKLAANGMGMTTAELMKQMQEGKVMSSELLPKLAAELHKTYGKAAVDAAKEGRAGLALFRNEVFETTAAIGARLLPAVNSIARSMADAMKTWREQPSGGWTNLLQGFSPNSAEYTDAWLRETFRLPTRDVALTDRDTRIANRLDNNHAARGSYDPQMSRAMADRRARQEEENERRAAKERFEAGKAERDKAAKEAEAAAEKARQDYNRGVQLYNRLVDNYNSLRPDLSETDRIILKLHDDVAALSKEHPEQAADAQRMEGKIISLLREADARKVANAQLKEEIKLLEKLNEDMTGFGGFAQGLGMNALELPKVGGTLGRDGRVTGNMPRFSLTGTAETGGFNGNSPENARAQEDADERRKIEERLNQDLLASKMKFGEESLALLELTSKKGSAIAIGAAVAQKALAVAQILMNSNSAATAALLPPPVGLGPIAGQALSAEIRAMGYLNAAMTGAIGIAQVAGGRASGGPVSAGQTYLVGEKGPELLTMGAADGYVTPNHALGGSTIQINNSYDFSGADAGTIQRLRAEINQSSERTKAQILASMNRGGEFALASGRAR